MKIKNQIIVFLIINLIIPISFAQTPVSALLLSGDKVVNGYSYTSNGKTYNWGIAPYNQALMVDIIDVGATGYFYATAVKGIIKLRRVDNAKITGNYSLQWAEDSSSGNTYNLLAQYKDSMELLLNDHSFNKGAENIFDNTSANSNNIERVDWILPRPYAISSTAKAGFGVFDRGFSPSYDAFCIAAITSVDTAGNPNAYSKIVRVNSNTYGEFGDTINYRVLKAIIPDNLLNVENSGENIAGVFITLQDLGITPNSPIYGYSLFANDLPVAATPADLVDYTNPVFFPTNTTSSDGGLDLFAFTGISVVKALLPVHFIDFNAIEIDHIINLKWTVGNDEPGIIYNVERSEDGVTYKEVGKIKSALNTTTDAAYLFQDDVSPITASQLFYRIKVLDKDGNFYYSTTIGLKLKNKKDLIIIYPNPAKGKCYVNIYSNAIDKVNLSLYNATGSKVLIQQKMIQKGNNSFTLEGIEQLAKGTYYLSFKWGNSDKVITKKLLID